MRSALQNGGVTLDTKELGNQLNRLLAPKR
jgi:hypothetical protein